MKRRVAGPTRHREQTTKGMQMRTMLLGATCAALLACIAGVQAQSLAEARVRSEEYVLTLDGDVGNFTAFRRDGITGFRGIETTATVDAVYGKKSDKWDSIGRINLETAKGATQPRRLSFFFRVDRVTKRVNVRHQVDDGPMQVVDLTYALKQPIPFRVAWKSPWC